ncbi:hypothetical protein FEF26_07865 [Nesterenkonia salmonea]|uniref:SF3 helicase domain-containing protein n=1 Tax=Nesterenkonia salmonea TaxID=1804987 RepID=A0A5R9BCN1_9MICC|nr:phage/plasmid primase, P4 family [Nesterenkonia salmonea]TLP97362.1 hypothetical protein FEF26_07865 [Nesterenkonia salmonea]
MSEDNQFSPQGLRETARELLAAGICCFPIGYNKGIRKMPLIEGWPDIQPTEEHFEEWWGENRKPHFRKAEGIAAVCGAPSGNLVLLEIEGAHEDKLPKLHEQFRSLGSRAEKLWQQVRTGWMEISPSGGVHWFIRLQLAEGEPLFRKERLALDEDGGVIAEANGARHAAALAPSYGKTHASGKPYERQLGGPDTIPVLFQDEFELVLDAFRSLNEGAAPATRKSAQPRRQHNRPPGARSTPWDDFNAKHDLSQMIEELHWTFVREQELEDRTVQYWSRPGSSNPRDHEAILTIYDEDHDERPGEQFFYAFAGDLPIEESLTAFGLFMHLEHKDDKTAAIKAASKAGYGQRPTKKQNSLSPAAIERGQAATGTDGVLVDLDTKRAEKSAESSADVLSGTLEQEHTDDANANLFASHHCEVIRFSSTSGVWMLWNGTRWVAQPSKGGAERELAKKTARELPTMEFDDQGEPDKSATNAMQKHKKYSLSRQGISNMLTMAASLPELVTEADAFDGHPWELNTPGGILNLRTGTLQPHDPEKLHTKLTKATPQFDADRGLWEDFLKVSVPDPEVRRYLKRLTGLALIGEVLEHVVVFIWGRSGRGKSTFVESLRTALGDYAVVVPDGLLLEVKGAKEDETEVVMLEGARFALIDEVKVNDRFDEKRFKKLSGGVTLNGRRRYQDHHNFTPSHTHFLVGNHQPNFDGSDDAMRRRLRVIPFDEDIPEDKKLPGLQARLINEHLGAVLAWAAEGAVEYHQYGLGEVPPLVKATTSDYAEESDPVGQFLDEQCLIAEHETILVSEFRGCYVQWCQARGLPPMGDKRIADALQRHGIKVGNKAPRSMHGRQYGGVRMLTQKEREARSEKHNESLGYSEEKASPQGSARTSESDRKAKATPPQRRRATRRRVPPKRQGKVRSTGSGPPR